MDHLQPAEAALLLRLGLRHVHQDHFFQERHEKPAEQLLQVLGSHRPLRILHG